MFGNVPVAFDGAARARKAANMAIDHAEKYGAHITFLTVIQIEFTAAGHPARPADKVWLSVGWSAAAAPTPSTSADPAPTPRNFVAAAPHPGHCQSGGDLPQCAGKLLKRTISAKSHNSRDNGER